jgi:tetratricopeptide (TPR) repeat protein
MQRASEPNGPLCRLVPLVRGFPFSGALAKARHLAAVSAAAVALSLGLPSESPAQEKPEDFAGIYLDKYLPPDAKLTLQATGEARARALAHYARGLSLEQQKRPEEAVRAFLEVLKTSPGEIHLARKVAYLFAQSGKRQEGRDVLQRAHEDRSDSPIPAIVLSEYLATFFPGDETALTEAMRLAEEAVEKHPTDAAGYEHLVKMHLASDPNTGQAKARAVIGKVLERDEKNPFFWLQIGQIAQRIWPLNPDQSPNVLNSLFEKALATGKDHALVRERAGDYFHDARQPERALEIFQQLVKDYPDRLELREKLARVHGALGQEDEMVAVLKEIVTINPQDADTHRELARIYLGREDFQNAMVHFREAMKLTNGTADEYDAIGRMIIFGAKMPADAIPFLERGAYLHAEDARLPFLLTFALVQAEKYADAVKWFEKTAALAAQSQPELLDAGFQFRFAAAVERSGDIDRAATLFRTCIDMLSKEDANDERFKELRAEAYNYLGYMWLENNKNVDEAGELIKEALALTPESGAITDSLGWFYHVKGRYEEARRELLKAEKMVEKPDGVIFDHLGQTYFQLKDLAKAVDYLKKAVELEPDNEAFKKRLAEYEAAQAKSTPPPAPAAPKAP